MKFKRKNLRVNLRIAFLAVPLSWVGLGCTELRTFAQLNPADVIARASDSPCVVITKGQPLQEVKACDHETHMEIIAPNWVRSYRKSDIHRTVNELYGQFETNPKLGPHGLTGAGADLWLDVALTDPNDVRFVVLFRTQDGMVLVREPLDLSRWHINKDALIFIPEFEYPSMKARKMGVVQVVPYFDVTAQHLESFLDSFEKKSSIRSFSVEGVWPYLTLRTTPFTETKLIRRLGQNAQFRDLIRQVIFVPAAEREGAKYRLMTMDLMSPNFGLR